MKVKDVFNLYQGNSFELMHQNISKDSNINFVSRTAQNNGVVARVDSITEINPFPAGLITVTLGGSVLSAFVQKKPFYTAFHIMVLEPKVEMSFAEKLYYCMCIKKNAYRYQYGRQANRTLKDIDLPNHIPQWVYETAINPITTARVNTEAPPLEVQKWGMFSLSALFIISSSADKNLLNSENGATPYIASSSDNNGITAYINAEPSQKPNTLTIARNGSVGSTFYQAKAYCSSPDDIRILTPRFEMTKNIGLFLKTVIEQEKFKYGYGRKLGTKRIMNVKIKLPTTPQHTPDWGFMENYIKSLPCSDRI
jgi:hypothetical protein